MYKRQVQGWIVFFCSWVRVNVRDLAPLDGVTGTTTIVLASRPADSSRHAVRSCVNLIYSCTRARKASRRARSNEHYFPPIILLCQVPGTASVGKYENAGGITKTGFIRPFFKHAFFSPSLL